MEFPIWKAIKIRNYYKPQMPAFLSTYRTVCATMIWKNPSTFCFSARCRAARSGAGLTVWPFAAFTPFISTDTSAFFSDVQLFFGVKEVQQGQLEEEGQGLASLAKDGWAKRSDWSLNTKPFPCEPRRGCGMDAHGCPAHPKELRHLGSHRGLGKTQPKGFGGEKRPLGTWGVVGGIGGDLLLEVIKQPKHQCNSF